MKKIEGCITAMITPFKDGKVDIEGLKNNVKFQIGNGVSGIVPLGTTGESPTINDDERAEIVKTVVSETAGKVPVIVGTGTNSTDKSVKYTKQAKELGADAVLVVTPYYNKPTQEGIFLHFAEINKVGIPIVVYNIQGRTAVNIETATLKRMAEELENVVAVKEASGNINQMMDVVAQMPDDFTVLVGDDSMNVPLISIGGKGVVSVLSNIMPKEVSEMTAAALEGDFEKAAKMHYELLPLMRTMFIETNPAPIKEAMNMKGMPSGPFRLPMCNMQEGNKEKLKQALEQAGVLK
ncbi:MAG: 4-hydroxy-tetrahydrodipicolinate synthase [bacterium]|nr:4-hydroxy-tetrahydrodipicolinate synthase [bacterium]